jgi:hypothetical protein
MIRRKQLVWYTVEGEEMALAREMGIRVAKRVAGGLDSQSNVYSGEERRCYWWINQLTGQTAQLAATKYITGDIGVYRIHQAKAGRQRTDHGIDIPPNIDVKSGLMKRRNTPPFTQELLVHPDEYKDGWIYLYCQVHELTKAKAEVCVVGWARSIDIEGKLSSKKSVPEGCLGLPAFKLRPIQGLREMWEVRHGRK